MPKNADEKISSPVKVTRKSLAKIFESLKSNVALQILLLINIVGSVLTVIGTVKIIGGDSTRHFLLLIHKELRSEQILNIYSKEISIYSDLELSQLQTQN